MDEDNQVDREEHQVQAHATNNVHAVPVGRLGARDADCVVVVPVEGFQFGTLTRIGLHDAKLADDFSKTATRDVVVLVLLMLPHLPFHRGQSCKPDEQRVDDEQAQRQPRRVQASHNQHRDDGEDRGEKRIGEYLQEVSHRSD